MAKAENINDYSAEQASNPVSSATFGANETGTCEKIGTRLTQSRSADVLQLKHHMRILRTKFGASSKIGHHASNVEGQIHTLEHGIEPGPTGDFQRANLEASIKRQLTGIARMVGA